MTLRIGLVVIVLLGAMSPGAWGQAPQNWQVVQAAGQPQPDQPVVPNNPTLQAREQYGPQPYAPPAQLQGSQPQGSQPQGPAYQPAGPVQGPPLPGQPYSGQPYPTPPPQGQTPPAAARPVQPPPPPFTLSQQEQAELDAALADWEQKSKAIRTFNCKLRKLDYNVTMRLPPLKKTDDPNGPTDQENGEINFAAPDKGAYHIEGDSPEKWICDGRSIFSYDYQKKVVTEYPLPPQLQGKAIADGPLPFIFGASAEKLKQRYYLRIIHNAPGSAPGQLWLQALPKYQQDAANFSRARLILNDADKLPVALELTMPNGRDRTVHMFDKPVVNNVFDILQGTFFVVNVPFGWSKKVEAPPQDRVTSQPQGPRR